MNVVGYPFIDETTQAIQRNLRPLHIRVVGRPRFSDNDRACEVRYLCVATYV